MKSSQIVAVVRQGRKIRTPWVVLYVRKQVRPGPAQISCIVGKKVHRLAVRRHRYQRWLREITRPWAKNLAHVDVVIVGQPGLVKIDRLVDLKVGLDPYLQHLVDE